MLLRIFVVDIFITHTVYGMSSSRPSLYRSYIYIGFLVLIPALGTAYAIYELFQGNVSTFNAGTGRGMTNRGVTTIVQQTSADLGFPFQANYDDPPGLGEAEKVVLDMERTVKTFGILPPGPAEVRETIQASVRACFESVGACT